MKKDTNKNYIRDYGRLIKNSKKEQYHLDDGEFKINLSKIWPKSQIKSPDRFCRYLTTILRKEIRTLLTTSKREANQFIRLVNFTKNSLNEISEPKEFYQFLNHINDSQTLMDFLFKDKTALLDYFNQDLVDIAMDMEEKHFEKTTEEIAYENVCSKLWFLKPDQIKVINSNHLELELSVEFETVEITINKNLDFKLQDPNLGFLVEVSNEGEHRVTNLNISKDEFSKIYEESYRKELLKLKGVPLKEQNEKSNNSVNPGIRVGVDYLNGSSVREKDIINKFGFCGQFGNYLSQPERRDLLNKLYLASCDLATALDCAPKNLSLQLNNGLPLGISLAARGSGRARGHFENQEYVINLTKRTLLELNCGVLAHEFGHAFDYWLGNKITNKNIFLSEAVLRNPYLFPEFTEIINFITLPNSVFSLNASNLDFKEGRRKPYWNLTQEKFARVFSSCIIEILKQKGIRNDFLAYNYNNNIGTQYNQIISPNPYGKELEKLTSMFKTLFKVLVKDGYLDKLEEDLTLKKPKYEIGKTTGFKNASQMSFF